MNNEKSVKNSNWIDVSVPLRDGMVVWPGDIEMQIERRKAIARGDDYNLSSLYMGVHTGTHMDAPRHFLSDTKTIDQIPFDAVIGPARVIEITDNESIKPEELEPYNIKRGERILFKTRNSQRCWQTDKFVTDFVYITRGAALFLAESGVKLVGIDYLSVASPADTEKTMPDTHKTLLGAEIWLLEGLDLSGVSAGNYELICLPLKLVQTEGSPVRAVLRPIK